MTIERVIRTADIRGIYFNSKKQWQNSMVGVGYSCYLPTGGFIQADTLYGLYKMIKRYPKKERR